MGDEEKGEKKSAARGNRIISPVARKLRRILTDNLKALLESRYYSQPKFPTKSAAEQAAAKDVGVSWSTIQRRLDPKDGVTLDVLADLAAAFNLRPFELLDPTLAESLRSERPLSEKTPKTKRRFRDGNSSPDTDELQRQRGRRDTVSRAG